MLQIQKLAESFPCSWRNGVNIWRIFLGYSSSLWLDAGVAKDAFFHQSKKMTLKPKVCNKTAGTNTHIHKNETIL